jgi:hypothetical protein
MEPDYNSHLFSPSEKLVAVLKQGYVTSAIQGEIATNSLVLSDKRLYQRGKIFEKVMNGRWISSSGQKVVDIKDVTGSGFEEVNYPVYMFFGILTLVLEILMIIVAANEGNGGIVILFLIFPLFFFLIYFILRKRIFVVYYAGGTIGTECRFYPENEILDFQKQIALLKDRY